MRTGIVVAGATPLIAAALLAGSARAVGSGEASAGSGEASAGSGEAGPRSGTAAVAALTFAGEVSEGLREALVKRLGAGLRASGLPVAGQLSCDHGQACLHGAWVKLGTRYVAGGRVSGADREFEIALWLADAPTGKVLARVVQRCEICGLQAVADKMELAASALRAKLAAARQAPGRLLVESDPPGAAIVIDGRTVGPAPRELLLQPGRHRVRLRREGYLPVERSISAVSGQQDRLRLHLIAAPRPSRRPLKVAGWVGGGAGLAALVAGIALLAVDGNQADCGGEQQVRGGQCPSVIDSAAGGWTLVSLGGVALVSGAYLLYRAYR
jgi:hypothetical protein